MAEYAITFRIGGDYARTAAVWPEGAERCSRAQAEKVPDGRNLSVVFPSLESALMRLRFALAEVERALDEVGDADTMIALLPPPVARD